MKVILLPVLLLILMAGCMAQSGRVDTDKPATPSVLSNQDVIDMFSAGLSETVIIAKITSSKTKFETDLPALRILKEAKIPENIVTKMIEASSEKAAGSAQPSGSPNQPEKSPEIVAADRVMAGLRRLDNAVEVGTTLQNYVRCSLR